MNKDELKKLRNAIDKIDEKIIELLSQRFDLTDKVGVLKKENNIELIDKSREEYQFNRIREISKKYNVPIEVSEKILRDIINQVVLNHNKINKSL